MASKGKKKLTAGQRAHIAKAKGTGSAPPRQSAKPSPESDSASLSTPSPMPAWVFWSGAVLILAMVALSLNLSLSHLGYATPGCGEGGSCDQIKDTRFAYVPGTFSQDGPKVTGWPIAYVGTAYFASLLVVWVMSSGTGLNTLIKQVIRVGAVASLAYIIIMLFVVKIVCPLCMATHLMNFALLGIVEFATPRTRALAGRSLGVAIAGLIVGNGVLLGVQQSRSAELDRLADAETQSLIDDLTGGSQSADRQRTPSQTSSGRARFDLPASTHGDGREGFTGRYLIGEPDAPIRIVTIAGFQCGSCQTIESEIRDLLDTRDDISLSMIQFPANSNCNPTLNRVNLHPAACRTAQIAEAAGMLGGSDAYWAMSFRLFEFMSQRDNLGRAMQDVPDAILDQWIQEFGFNAAEFRRTMGSREVNELIARDARLARSVGTNQTPMVFINGREFTSWNRTGQLTRTVEALGNQNLPRQTAAADSPPGAAERLTAEWRTQSPISTVPSQRDWIRGAGSDAEARIVVWGCYDEQNTQRVDSIARELARQYPGVSYEFRFYPFNSECNRRVNTTTYTQSCVKVKAAVAAGLLGGAEAHQRMHDWIMQQAGGFQESDLPAEFAAIGLDPEEALAAMQSREVAELIQNDSNLLESYRSRNVSARPAVFVNERPTPWLFGTDTLVLPTVVQTALDGDGG